MANVRSRPKTQSSAKMGRGAAKSKSVNNVVESVTVMKSTSVETSEDIVQSSPEEDIIVQDIVPNPDSISKVKEFIGVVSKSGRIKRKTKEKLKLLDNILKSELLILDPVKKAAKKKNVNNNNNNGIDDNNKKSDPNGIKLREPINLSEEKQVISKRKYTFKSRKPPIPLYLRDSPEPQLYECDYCHKIVNTKRAIEKHVYGHLNLKPHRCPHCPKKFHYHSNMQVHVMKLHKIPDEALEPLMCRICGKAFLAKETLNAHLSTHHSKKASFFKCICCENRYSDEVLLFEHEKKHLVAGRYQCATCGFTYGIRNHFAAHLKSHVKVKDFVCQFCGKEFLRLNSMQRHVQVYHAGHRIQCPICKKKLKGHLTEHLRTHDKKRPHECPDCGQCFTQSTQLTVHRRSHSGARPYPCKICARCFSHSTALMLHIRRHTGEKPFPCAMCPLMFSQLPHMKAHMRTIHGKENAYKCKHCPQFFKLKVEVEQHAKTCVPKERIDKKVKSLRKECDSAISLTRLRFLLALLLTIISTKDKLKCLGFNKRLIDDLLIDCLVAMDLNPCRDQTLSPLKRLKKNIDMLLERTVPKEQMEKLKNENKSTEELLELLTDEIKFE